MKDRQRRFADEYLIDLNAEAAAVRAGYSPRYARGNAYKLVARSGIKEYIEKRMAEKESELIADQNEVLRYLTALFGCSLIWGSKGDGAVYNARFFGRSQVQEAV